MQNGIYVAQLGGGQVNTAGDFVFSVTEAYLIENGEITARLREGNLIGNGPTCFKTSKWLVMAAMEALAPAERWPRRAGR